jgi:16S rRNA (uracil1498-N3)-methyltransferase
MHRFFLTERTIAEEKPVDLSPLARQLARVLRLQPGAQIEILDGEGNAYLVEIVSLSPRTGSGRVLARRIVESEPDARLTLYQCSLKADKFEWVLQKGTELGVSRFVPVISRRSIVRPAAALLRKYERWRAIIREAAEQSGRGRLPALADPLDFTQVVETASGCRLLPYEEANASPEVPSLGGAVRGQCIAPRPAVNLLIGPEGGFDPQEIDQVREAGWTITTLGPRILRAETAALAAVTVVMDRLGELGGIADNRFR